MRDLPRNGLGSLAAMACLTAAGAIEGLLLARAPILQDYTAVRLGPEGALVPLAWLCVLGMATLGALAGLATWLRTAFLSLLVVPITWSLAKASQHPWWILKVRAIKVTAPSAPVLAGHALAIALVCAAVLVDALSRQNAAMKAQQLSPATVSNHTWRLGLRATGLTGACLLLAFLLPGLLDPLAGTLRGSMEGTTAFIVLVTSAAALLAGLALLMGRERAEPET